MTDGIPDGGDSIRIKAGRYKGNVCVVEKVFMTAFGLAFDVIYYESHDKPIKFTVPMEDIESVQTTPSGYDWSGM